MTDDYNKRYWTYHVYLKELSKKLDETVDDFIIGSEISMYVRTFNTVFTLLQLRNEKNTSARPSRKLFEQCLRTHALCAKLNIARMEAEWPPSYNDNCEGMICSLDIHNVGGGGGSGDDPNDTNDGIGVMQISPNENTDIPVNRISSKN